MITHENGSLFLPLVVISDEMLTVVVTVATSVVVASLLVAVTVVVVTSDGNVVSAASSQLQHLQKHATSKQGDVTHLHESFFFNFVVTKS